MKPVAKNPLTTAARRAAGALTLAFAGLSAGCAICVPGPVTVCATVPVQSVVIGIDHGSYRYRGPRRGHHHGY